jgi:hypothetical protein
MAENPEALAQLARLLQDGTLRTGGADAIRTGVDAGFERLVAGILEEAAASDDVIDGESARAFVEDRVGFLGALLNHEQRSRLLQALRDKIEAWQ